MGNNLFDVIKRIKKGKGYALPFDSRAGLPEQKNKKVKYCPKQLQIDQILKKAQLKTKFTKTNSEYHKFCSDFVRTGFNRYYFFNIKKGPISPD